MIATILIAAALVAAGSSAARASAAEAAFAAGRWEAVTVAGRAEGGADALALSARALLVRAAYQARSRADVMALIAEAERDVAAALALDPANRVALLQRAATTGYRAKFERSLAKAHSGRDQMRVLAARHGYWSDGWLALGLWHGETVAAVGAFVARTVVGANLDAMARNFDRAAALEPDSPVPPAMRGLLLARLGAGAPGEARRLLAQAQRLRARDGYEALVQRQAAQVLAALDAGGARAGRDAASALAPFASLGG